VGGEYDDPRAVARYDAAVERGGFGLWEIRDDRRTLYANGTMRGFLEVERFEDLVPLDPGVFFADHDPTREGVRGAVYVELRGARGGRRYVVGVASRVSGAGAESTVWSFADVTDMRRAQERAQQAQRLEAIGRLAGGIAHDFNNLLTVVYTCSALLRRRLREGDPLRTYVEQIDAAAKRGGDLTRQVLSFARDRAIEPRIVDMNDVLRKMTSLLKRLIGDDVELRENFDPSLRAVRADRSQLEQVIMNLALNARDAMPRGGKLVVSTTNVDLDGAQANDLALAPGEYVLLGISDTGIGMDEATRARVFEPFFTTKAGKGTGLGLATSFGIVRQSSGAIAVESTPGKGATVRVWLPAADLPPDEDDDAPPSAARPGTETVLLVDDDDPVREPLAEFLRLYGLTVLEARSGLTAIEHAKRYAGEIHVLVTDVVMPRMGGKSLAEALIALRPNLKVLYLTGHSESTIHRRGQLEPGAAILQKPFPPEALVSRIHELAVVRPPG
jgi:two-component system cell cycle sensor histidine kinase/response regulator CckA